MVRKRCIENRTFSIKQQLLTVASLFLYQSLWDDMGKSLFPGYMKEATRCSEQLLPTLSKYMKEVSTESHDMILLNPWLVRPGTAGPLSSEFIFFLLEETHHFAGVIIVGYSILYGMMLTLTL